MYTSEHERGKGRGGERGKGRERGREEKEGRREREASFVLR